MVRDISIPLNCDWQPFCCTEEEEGYTKLPNLEEVKKFRLQ
jgi:hypothetical protein